MSDAEKVKLYEKTLRWIAKGAPRKEPKRDPAKPITLLRYAHWALAMDARMALVNARLS